MGRSPERLLGGYVHKLISSFGIAEFESFIELTFQQYFAAGVVVVREIEVHQLFIGVLTNSRYYASIHDGELLVVVLSDSDGHTDRIF